MFFDLLGDLGGVRELFVISFGIFLLPISEHAFVMKASKYLFFARTSKTQLFEKFDKDIRLNKFLDSGLLTKPEVNELAKHNKIKIGTRANIKLYLHRKFKNTIFRNMCKFQDAEILNKLFDRI